MQKRAVTRFLIGFHLVVFGAVFLRIDTFPLTWVPMYSQFHGIEDLTVPVGDKVRLKQGFEVTTLSGETEYVGAKELNIPGAAFRRIYTERAFGKGPPKHLRERTNLNPLSEAIFNQFYPDPAASIVWSERILDMLNATLERESGDPDYIVSAEATYDFATFSREARRLGDVDILDMERKTATITRSGS